MTRVAVVVALGAVFVLARLLYERRSAALADRSRIDHPALPHHLRGPGRTWVVFATQFCATCGPVADRLSRLHPDETVHKVLVEDDPGLADTYSVRTAPTLLEVDASGTVVRSVAGAVHVLRFVDSLAVA